MLESLDAYSLERIAASRECEDIRRADRLPHLRFLVHEPRSNAIGHDQVPLALVE